MPDLNDHQLDEAFSLWKTAGWNEGYRIDAEQFRSSWQASAVTKGIVMQDRLVAIGRAQTDGVLYGMIYDIVVHPEFRGMGLGSAIVRELLESLQSQELRVIQLMAAEGQAGFYERLGFVKRPETRPGMQWSR